MILNTGLMKENPSKGTHWTPTPMPQGGWYMQVDISGSGGQAPRPCMKYGTTRGLLNCAFPGCCLYGKILSL